MHHGIHGQVFVMPLPIKFIKLMQDAGVGLMLRDQCNITITEKLKYLA